MGNRESAYSRTSRRHRSFRLHSSIKNIILVLVIAAFVALILWALDL